MNRLLTNMKLKIETLNSSIDTALRLKNGETIEIDGLYKMSLKSEPSEKFDKILSELFEEIDNLQVRINRIEGITQ